MFAFAASQTAFYDAFHAHAEESVAAAKLVLQMLENPERSRELSISVSDAEHRGDKITHELIARLRRTKTPPFHRADVRALITMLDDILDLIEAVAERIVIFEIREPIATATSLAALLIDATQAVERATRLLPHFKKKSDELLGLCVEINQLENKADLCYRKGLAAAFAPGNDPLLALKWRDIYEYLEAATDRCEDVANVMEGVVLESS